MKLFLRLSVLVLGMVAIARGDMVGYGGPHDCSASRDGFVFRHQHDWNWNVIDKLFEKHGSDPKAIFSDDNTFSHVELVDRSGKTLFRKPSPALTHLWVSPGAEYLVGISNVQLRNPYHLVIWRSDGTLVHARHISPTVARLTQTDRIEFIRRFPMSESRLSEDYFLHAGALYLAYDHHQNDLPEDAWDFLKDFRVSNPIAPDISASVTNWIWWFDGQDPAIALEKKDRDLLLNLRSRKGRLISLLITREPPGLTKKP